MALSLLTATVSFHAIGKALPITSKPNVGMIMPEPFLQYPGMALPPSAFPTMYGASDELVGVMELSLLGGIFVVQLFLAVIFEEFLKA